MPGIEGTSHANLNTSWNSGNPPGEAAVYAGLSMRLNLDSLRSEIQEYLQSRGIVIFHSYPRSGERGNSVYWDTDRDSDFRNFLAAAEAAGVRLITLYSRELEDDLVEDALEQLSESNNIDRDERRTIESRLKEIRGYAGFTCQIELSFDLATRTYIFDLRTEWFDDLNDLVDRIEDSYDDEDEGDAPMTGSGGYFSRN